MALSRRQICELRNLMDKSYPLWVKVPPEKAHPDLKNMIDARVIHWVAGKGYYITQIGRDVVAANSTSNLKGR